MEKLKKVAPILATLGMVLSALARIFPTEIHDWVIGTGATMLASAWPVIQGALALIPYAVILWLYLAVRTLRQAKPPDLEALSTRIEQRAKEINDDANAFKNAIAMDFRELKERVQKLEPYQGG